MTNTVKGRVQAISLKPKKDYYGICIDDTWYNGSGNLDQNLEEAEVELELKSNSEDFIDIKEINVLEEASEDGTNTGRDGSDTGKGGEKTNAGKTSSPNPKRANIMATAATKKAADIVGKDGKTEGEFIDEVSTVATGLNNIMNKLYEENMQQ